LQVSFFFVPLQVVLGEAPFLEFLESIGKCLVAYFDDILVYPICMDDHIVHVKNVLQLIKNESLYTNLEKFMD
ncbi:hypothetical protein CR513_22865, partial [Mucuna pruriens]